MRTRIALADREGLLRWERRDIEASDAARLSTSPFDGTVWLVDPALQRATVLDPRTGQTLRVHVGDPSYASSFSIDDGRAFAIDWDGSFLAAREVPGLGRTLLRFDAQGVQQAVWPSAPRSATAQGETTWESLTDFPVVLPAGALISIGWDGCMYAASHEGRFIAKLTRAGKLLGVITLPHAEIDALHAFAASRDGVLHVLHTAPNDRNARVSRISSTGMFGLAFTASSHSHGGPRLGPADDKMKLLPDGTMFIAKDFDSLRVIGPDLARLFVSNATRRLEKSTMRDERRASGMFGVR